MNREIKYRVWCKDYNEWEKDEILINKDGIPFHVTKGLGLRIIRPENHIVQFYTGLQDKNGKDIYEGDILRIKNFDGWFDKVGFYNNIEVKWSEKEFGDTDGVGFHYISKDREIIGNIFENPELLK